MDPAYRYTLNESGKFVGDDHAVLPRTPARLPPYIPPRLLLNTPTEKRPGDGAADPRNGKSARRSTSPVRRWARSIPPRPRAARTTTSPTTLPAFSTRSMADRDTWQSRCTPPALDRRQMGHADHDRSRVQFRPRRWVSVHSLRRRSTARWQTRGRVFRRLERRSEIRLSVNPTNGKWFAETLDKQRLDRALSFSRLWTRTGEPTITYYDRTNKDLKMASPVNNTARLQRDADRHHRRRRAFQQPPARSESQEPHPIGHRLRRHLQRQLQVRHPRRLRRRHASQRHTNYTVDDLPDAGGYVSLAFYDSGTNDSKRHKPAMSYYDASESALRFAKSTDGGATGSADYVPGATKNIQGLYTQPSSIPRPSPDLLLRPHEQRSAPAILNNKGWNRHRPPRRRPGDPRLAECDRYDRLQLPKRGDGIAQRLHDLIEIALPHVRFDSPPVQNAGCASDDSA